MYVPPAFAVHDREALFEFLEAHDFATLVSHGPEGLDVTHVPLLLRRAGEGVLLGHVARANPHRHRFDGRTPALAIFHGPHAYVSPAWYVKGPAVPTWNYAIVHVHGTPSLIEDDAEKAALLAEQIERYEAGRADRWRPELPEDFAVAMRGAIEAFALPIERIEAKFKLGQNRSPADQAGTLAGLDAGGADGRALADLTRAFLGEG